MPPAGVSTKSYSQPLGSLERTHIDLDFAAGSLTVGNLVPESLNLVEANSKMRNGSVGIKADFHSLGNEGKLRLSTEEVKQPFWDKERIRQFEVNFTRNIPLTMNVKSAASNLDLDFSKLEVTELRVDIDVGNCRVKIPSSAGTTRVTVKADVANVDVTIPSGIAARFKEAVSLGSFEVDESRFPRKGSYYISPNFESAQNRVEIEFDCALSRINVE